MCYLSPPNANVRTSIELLEQTMIDMSLNPRRDFVCLGNMNIDYNSKNPHKMLLNDFPESYNMTQHISVNTSVTPRSTTCIDHVYVNNRD